jgi:4-amino-4-deoxy-L-arabinose transferase-like glycosyltransferase
MKFPTSISGESIPAESAAGDAWRRRLMIAMLTLMAAVILFYNLGDCRTLGSHEVYAAVPAQEMLASGNWIVPRFGGLPRLEKPPLSYWVLAASSRLFGRVDEWSVRFPAAVSALMLSALMGVWAGRWYGRAAGMGAALVQFTSVYVIIFGRKAEVDMLLCLLTTSALFLIAGHQSDESPRRTRLRWIGIYCLLSLAWLAKFHYGLAMVLGPCVIYFLIQRRYRSLGHLANPIGLAIFMASVLIWPYLLLQQVPEAWQVWRWETVGRAVGELGQQPLWFYIPHLLWLSLPWTPLAIAAIPASWRQAWRAADARERFLWVWLLTVLAIITISADKHKHYLIAALPVFSLLAGQRFALLARRVRQGQPVLNVRGAVILSVVCWAMAAFIFSNMTQKWPHLSTPLVTVGLILGLGGSAFIWLLTARKVTAAQYVAIFAFLGCYLGVTGWILPGRDHRLPAAQFARKIRHDVSSQQEVGVYRMGMNAVVYYLGDPVYRLESAQAVNEQLTRRQQLLLVTYEPMTDELSQLGRLRIVRQLDTPPSTQPPKHPPLVLVELTAPSMIADSSEQSQHPSNRRAIDSKRTTLLAQ